MTYASAGNGTNPHIAMELFKSKAGIDVRHIPYRGVGPALQDVVAGRISSMSVNILSAKPLVDSGNLRALAVTSAKRADQMPDVPTVAEAGLPGAEVLQWFGLLAPAGTPKPIIDKLHDTLATAFAKPEVKAHFAAEGAEPVGNTPAEFAVIIKDEIKMWTDVAKAAKIEPVN
jgi:tripartite-type tricarboxylate transporter receptor subunit TctC